ncbi:hypothetical protein AAF712_006683 [Marasmius tenuissimus]|uniref:Uncharacterized protein n=1 Tax=Marasmius tenuissimus TaxID=585030 RepID=A0ABR3A121_9AGAR|nr:hypothetical protein PM082_019263 [Marasmius tenuissimus]KAJ8075052.1 hypothetical protein PM082_019379 [Marasmius tenuissimus]
MSHKHSKLWSKMEEEDDGMGWVAKKNAYHSLDDVQIEVFDVKRRKRQWQDQSPSKKSGSRRVSRRPKERAEEGKSQKARKAQTVDGLDNIPPSSSQEFNASVPLNWEDVSEVTTAPRYESPVTESGIRLSEEVVEQYLREFQEGRVGFYHIGTFLFIVQDWSIEDSAPLMASPTGLIFVHRKLVQMSIWNVVVQMVDETTHAYTRSAIWNLGMNDSDGWKTIRRQITMTLLFSFVGSV